MITTTKQKNIIYPEVKIGHVAKFFWNGLKQQKWLFFFCFVFLILANIISVVIPIFYKNFFDIIVVSGEKHAIAEQLISIIVQIGILHLFLWVFYRVATYLNIVYSADTMARLKQQAHEYMIEHSYGFFSNNFAGSLVQKVNRAARAFETFTDQTNWNLLPLFIRTIAITGIIYFTNKWIAIVILIWALIFLGFNIIFSKWKVKYDIIAASKDSKTTGYLADTITNQNTIQLFAGHKFEAKGFKEVSNEQAVAAKTSWHLDSVADAVQSFLIITIEFVLFYFAIKYWEAGVITVGFFVMLQIYILVLMEQLWSFSRVIRHFYQAYADSKEMVEVMLLPHEIKDKPMAKELNVKHGQINFENLSFNFNETRPVLKNINLEIKPGERVALIGASGAGKTTFVRLLLSLYRSTSGRILIDGQDISDITQKSLAGNISMVPQDTILFHRTLSENISYGKRGASKEEIEEAAKLAHCDEFIKNMPLGLETFVGERGIKLSGGERQRVAIARAILKNAPILVLDEATSSLDSASELLIQDALNNLMKGKTVIVIAHRLSTIQKMDRIIVVEHGEIIEQGSHSELLAKEKSLYKKLWELQAGGFLASENENESSPTLGRDDNEEDDEDWPGVSANMASF